MKPIIGIPVKGDIESFQEMFRSLLNSTNYFERIIIINPPGEDNEFYDNYERTYRFVTVLHEDTKTPLEAYNFLFEYAKHLKMDLFLTQSDVIFPKLYKRDWLQMFSGIAQDERVGAVTSINGGGISGDDYINGFEWLGGWCVYYPYRTLEKIGGFDEGFPNGNGVDIDHSYRIIKSGLAIIKLPYFVDHHMMNERLHDNSPNAEQDRKASAGYFRKKWNLEK